jgi:hypothetical protein
MSERMAVVDGANVAYAERSKDGAPRVSNMVAMGEALAELGYDFLFIVDATLRHEVDDHEHMESLLDEGAWRQAPAGTDADYFILETAERFDGLVVSNDEFEGWEDDYSWIHERRVPFMIIRGEVVLHDREPSQA